MRNVKPAQGKNYVDGDVVKIAMTATAERGRARKGESEKKEKIHKRNKSNS